jgi:hypothetical protein
MPDITPKYRDGTNKFNRAPAALDPAKINIDDRAMADWLAFAQEYAAELFFYNSSNETQGPWTPLLYPSKDAYEIAKSNELNQTGNPAWWPANWSKTIEAYMTNASEVYLNEQQKELISRPHFELFLVFLKLLKKVRVQINEISGRHLNFYFRQFLQLLNKAPKADQVHVLIQLAKGKKHVRIPKDALLDAGTDPDGQPLYYKTVREAVFNSAWVKEIRTLFASAKGGIFVQNDPLATAEQSGLSWWKTFGKKPDSEAEEGIDVGRIGFVISSPVLYLENGSRVLLLDVNFATPLQELGSLIKISTFTFWVSTGEGMKRIAPKFMNISSQKLTYRLLIPASFPPVIPLSPDEAISESLPGRFPILCMRLNENIGTGSYLQYPVLKKLIISSIDLKVDVGNMGNYPGEQEGLTNLSFQNDEKLIDPKKPFEPFTHRPKKGSGLYFTHPEIAAKKLENVSLDFEWANLPDDIDDDYQDYWRIHETPQNEPPEDFKKVDLKLVEKSKEISLVTGHSFFNESERVTKGIEDEEQEAFDYDDTARDVVNSNKFFSLRLKDDLAHGSYATLQNKQIRKGIKDEHHPWLDITLIPPYVPQLLSVRMKYVTSITYSFDVSGAADSRNQFFQLHPFGYREFNTEEDLITSEDPTLEDSGISFLPVYGDIDAEGAQDAGELYIGVDALNPPQSLSLLFQLVEGSAEAADSSPKIKWSVLSNDSWIDLKRGGFLVSDDTMDLVRPGIVLFQIPQEANTQNHLLPGGMHWVRGQMSAFPEAVCDTIAIHTQAVKAVLAGPDQRTGHLDKSLPKEQIKGLKQPIAGISKIIQPYASFGGRPAEKDSQFYVRVSERLRHKQRAVSSWDYERLILEKFPGVYKVKCLPADTFEEAGTVQFVVIPDIRGGRPYDTFAPKVPADQLKAIRLFLESHAPATATIKVFNPLFDTIEASVILKLKPQYVEEDYYSEQINLAIQQFLSPWAFDPETDIVFGGRLYVSLLVNFIEELEYVDYVKKIYMKNTSVEGGEVVTINSDQSYLEASSPRHVFVSEQSHYIEIVPQQS